MIACPQCYAQRCRRVIPMPARALARENGPDREAHRDDRKARVVGAALARALLWNEPWTLSETEKDHG